MWSRSNLRKRRAIQSDREDRGMALSFAQPDFNLAMQPFESVNNMTDYDIMKLNNLGSRKLFSHFDLITKKVSPRSSYYHIR